MNSKQLFVAFMMFAAVIGNVAHAQQKSAGLVVGLPSGFSFKYWFDHNFFSKNQEAVDIAIGAEGLYEAPLFFKMDYTVHHYDLIPVEPGKLPLYYGIGVRMVTGSSADIGIRVPIGVNYIFEEDPFDAFAEVAPTLLATPKFKPVFGVAIGFRYRFK